MATVSERLRWLRNSLNMSQTKFAGMMGSSQSTLNRYENEQSEAPYKILLWYADYFDISLDYIFGRTDNPQGKQYGYEPETLKKKFANQEVWQEFVEACFDPSSPMNAKLKEMMMTIAGGADA